MKRNLLVITAVALTAIGIGLWGFLSLRGSVTSTDRNLLSVFPGHPVTLLRINHPDDLRRQMLYNNTVWSYWTECGVSSPMRGLLEKLDTLSESAPELYARLANRTWAVAWYLTENGGEERLTPLICTKSSQEDSRTFDPLLKRLNGFHFYQTDGITALSPDAALLEASRTSLPAGGSSLTKDSLLCRLESTANRRVAANLLLDLNGWRNAMAPHWQNGRRPQIGTYEGWMVLDWEGNRGRWTLGGFSAQAGENDGGSPWNAAEHLPSSCYWFQSHQTDSTFTLPEEESAWTSASGESPRLLLQTFMQGGYALAACPDGGLLVIQLKDGEAAATVLRNLAEGLHADKLESGYRFAANGWAGHLLGETFTFPEEHLGIAGNLLYLCSDATLLKKCLSSAGKGQHLSQTGAYQALQGGLQSTCSESGWLDLGYLIRHADHFLTPEFLSRHADWLVQLGAFQALSIQTDHELYGMDYQHILLQQTGNGKVRLPLPAAPATEPAAAAETPGGQTKDTTGTAADGGNDALKLRSDAVVYTVKLDAPAAIRPAWFTNHNTGATEVVVQDTRNQLYLIALPGTSGGKAKILWKAVLKERIVGDIHTVDILRNGKLQMAFTTGTQFYLIDRNGRHVKGYPRKLGKKTAGGLSVVDYEGNKDYRFFIGTTDGSVLLYKNDGTRPKDWSFKPTGHPIDAPVAHFSADGKDYLTIQSAGKLSVVDRRGRVRVQPATPMPCSGNPVYLEAVGGTRRFITSGTDGTLQYLGTDGKRTSAALDRSYRPEHTFLQQGGILLLGDSQSVDLYNQDGDVLQKWDGSLQGKAVLDNGYAAYKEGGRLHLRSVTDGSEYAGFPVAADGPFLYNAKGWGYANKNMLHIVVF